MNATNVLLIRHGQSRGNAERRFGGHTATPLSARGRNQAEATARTLKSESLTAIYSSDLARAMETAKPLANMTGLTVQSTNAFRERDVGVMEGGLDPFIDALVAHYQAEKLKADAVAA